MYFCCMAALLTVPSFSDHRGSLHVLETIIPYDIKRVYYIHGVPGEDRGGHRHKTARQVLICLHGSCTIYLNDGKVESEITLNTPDRALLVEPEDWHIMKSFSKDSILLVLASTPYDVNDYIDAPYA